MGGGGPTEPAGSASYFTTLQNLIKPFVGAGILALPNAFNVGGVLASSLIMAVLGVGVVLCINGLLQSVDSIYAREHGLEYDRHSGKFSLPDARGDSTPSTNRTSIQDPVDGQPIASASIVASIAANDGKAFALTDSSSSSPPALTSAPTSTSASGGAFDPLSESPYYSFRQVGERAFGRIGCFAVDFNLVASQLGFCIAYMSFISQNMTMVIDSVSRVEWICILFGGWCIITQLRSIKSISFTSVFGNVVYIFSLGSIFYYGFKNHCCIPSSSVQLVRPDGLALVFGTGCFALEGVGLVLPVKRSMQKKHQDNFGAMLKFAITSVVSLYILFGVLGYMFFGDSVHSVITDNLNAGGIADAVRVTLCISLFFTYVIQIFPVSEVLDDLWDAHVFRIGGASSASDAPDQYHVLGSSSSDALSTAVTSSPTSRENAYKTFADAQAETVVPSDADAIQECPSAAPKVDIRREVALVSTRVALVAFTAGISMAFPNFGLIVSLVGSFSNSAIAFILPQMFYIKLVLMPELLSRPDSDSKWTRRRPFVIPVFIIVLGIAASVIGVYTTVDSMITGNSN